MRDLVRALMEVEGEEELMTRGSFYLIRMGRAPGSVGIQANTCLYYPNYSVQDEQWAKQVPLF